MNEQIKLEKVRDFNELFNDTFLFVKYNFKTMFMGLLTYVVPIALLQGIFMGIFQYGFLGPYTEKIKSGNFSGGIFPDLSDFWGLWALIPGYFILFIMAVFLTLYISNFLLLYNERGVDNFTNADVWEGMKQKMGSIIFAYILVGIIIVFAFLALIIPGIYLANVFLIIAPVIVIGRKSVGDAMGECFRLMKGNWWKTFLFVFVLNIIGSVISLVFTLPSSIYNAVITSLSLTGGVAMNQYLTIFFSMIQSVGYVLVYSLMYIGLGLVYFNLVEQKDSTGLLNELDSIGDSE